MHGARKGREIVDVKLKPDFSCRDAIKEDVPQCLIRHSSRVMHHTCGFLVQRCTRWKVRMECV